MSRSQTGYVCNSGNRYTREIFTDYFCLEKESTESSARTNRDLVVPILRRFREAGLGRSFDEARRNLQAHLRNCDACRNEFQGAKQDFDSEQDVFREFIGEDRRDEY